MLKVKPHPDYPPEEGRYIRGNDASPVAVAIILNCEADKVPLELTNLVRVGAESGAALSGMAVLSVAGFVTMMAIFGSAYLFAWFFRKNWI